MQKKLIALAVAGLASSAAFAQTNVTIYGVADATFDAVRSNGGSKSGAASTDIGTFTRVSTNSSLLGFRGEEALGNGLKALFQYEIGVGFDSGAALSMSRDSFVGLNSDKWGTVKLGKLTGPTRALGATADVFAGATGIGANSGILGKLGNRSLSGNAADSTITVPAAACGRSATCTSVFDTRWNNAIAYTSPTFSGLSGTAVYVANENKTRDGLDNTAGQLNTKGYDLGLNYTNGPIWAGLTYNWATLGIDGDKNALGTVEKVSELRLAGSYDFGIATIRGLYGRTHADLNLTASNLNQNVWGLGGTFNVGGTGKIVGQYYRANDVSGNGTLKQGAALWALGYEHSLSKRTMLKATYAHLSSDRDAAYDFGVNATGANNTDGTNSGISLGIRHTF